MQQMMQVGADDEADGRQEINAGGASCMMMHVQICTDVS